jgi:hypothetical protein
MLSPFTHKDTQTLKTYTLMQKNVIGDLALDLHVLQSVASSLFINALIGLWQAGVHLPLTFRDDERAG